MEYFRNEIIIQILMLQKCLKVWTTEAGSTCLNRLLPSLNFIYNVCNWKLWHEIFRTSYILRPQVAPLPLMAFCTVRHMKPQANVGWDFANRFCVFMSVNSFTLCYDALLQQKHPSFRPTHLAESLLRS